MSVRLSLTPDSSEFSWENSHALPRGRLRPVNHPHSPLSNYRFLLAHPCLILSLRPRRLPIFNQYSIMLWTRTENARRWIFSHIHSPIGSEFVRLPMPFLPYFKSKY